MVIALDQILTRKHGVPDKIKLEALKWTIAKSSVLLGDTVWKHVELAGAVADIFARGNYLMQL
jgi:hypothetical protein